MITQIRQFFSVALILSLLSANGLYFAPLLKKQRSEGEAASMQSCCCCCNSGNGMASTCCCASRHSGRNDYTTCSVSSAPCAAPLAALSPNVLDQGIAPQLALNNIVWSTTSEKFSGAAKSPLSGKPHSLYHPPQPSFSLFS